MVKKKRPSFLLFPSSTFDLTGSRSRTPVRKPRPLRKIFYGEHVRYIVRHVLYRYTHYLLLDKSFFESASSTNPPERPRGADPVHRKPAEESAQAAADAEVGGAKDGPDGGRRLQRGGAQQEGELGDEHQVEAPGLGGLQHDGVGAGIDQRVADAPDGIQGQGRGHDEGGPEDRKDPAGEERERDAEQDALSDEIKTYLCILNFSDHVVTRCQSDPHQQLGGPQILQVPEEVGFQKAP